MVWDANLPIGGVGVNLGDNAIRMNNVALETALDTEHRFITGGGATGQSGRHRFGMGTAAARDAISDLLHDGAVWAGVEIGDPVDTAQWWIRDQTGLNWRSASTYMRSVANVFLKANSEKYIDLGAAIVGATASDWEDGNFFKGTTGGDFTLSNPTNKPVHVDGAAGTWIYEITQGVTFPDAITFDSDFIFPLGIPPLLSPGSGQRDLLICTLLPDGKIMVSVANAIAL